MVHLYINSTKTHIQIREIPQIAEFQRFQYFPWTNNVRVAPSFWKFLLQHLAKWKNRAIRSIKRLGGKPNQRITHQRYLWDLNWSKITQRQTPIVGWQWVYAYVHIQQSTSPNFLHRMAAYQIDSSIRRVAYNLDGKSHANLFRST